MGTVPAWRTAAVGRDRRAPGPPYQSCHRTFSAPTSAWDPPHKVANDLAPAAAMGWSGRPRVQARRKRPEGDARWPTLHTATPVRRGPSRPCCVPTPAARQRSGPGSPGAAGPFGVAAVFFNRSGAQPYRAGHVIRRESRSPGTPQSLRLHPSRRQSQQSGCALGPRWRWGALSCRAQLARVRGAETARPRFVVFPVLSRPSPDATPCWSRTSGTYGSSTSASTEPERLLAWPMWRCCVLQPFSPIVGEQPEQWPSPSPPRGVPAGGIASGVQRRAYTAASTRRQTLGLSLRPSEKSTGPSPELLAPDDNDERPDGCLRP